MRMRTWLLLLSFVTLVLAGWGPASAQDSAPPRRDPLDLARRFLGAQQDTPLVDPTPTVALGDRETFWVARRDAAQPEAVEARAVAVADGVYVFVEEGLDVNGIPDLEALAAAGQEPRGPLTTEAAMVALGQQYTALFQNLRLRSVYGLAPAVPLEQGEQPLPEDLLPVPDVDGSAPLFVLYTTRLPGERIAYYNPVDSIPAALLAGGFSNQREMILVNTTIFNTPPIDDPIYTSAVARAYLDMVTDYNFGGQAAWLRNALNDLQMQLMSEQNPPELDMRAFLDSPTTSLLALPQVTDRPRVEGGQQLFLNYFFQRYGQAAFRALLTAPGTGVAAIDAALAESGSIDLVTNEPVTARSAFADFALANVINSVFGDGRYVHTSMTFSSPVRARVTPLQELADTTLANRPLPQFGSTYLALQNTGEQPVALSINFDGAAQSSRFVMPDRAAADAFYWSGLDANANPRLTRTIDLRAATTARLTFDAWYDLARGLDYAYVSVSTDGGTTWTILPTTPGTQANPFGAAYGPGMTGVSGSDAPLPFPALGIALDGTGIVITGLDPDGPAVAAGLEVGDVIAGYDGQQWDRIPNLIEVLGDYAVGDTITLLIQRGEDSTAPLLEIPVTLIASPFRTLEADPVWVRHEADLSAFAGQEVLLRFEVVTLSSGARQGFALDNLEIAEVNAADDGSTLDAWTTEGFVSLDNQVEQRYIVQAVLGPASDAPPSVQPLIGVQDSIISGSWPFTLAPQQFMLLAVSAVSDQARGEAVFSLGVDVTEPGV